MAIRNNSATPGTSRLLGYDWLWLELSIRRIGTLPLLRFDVRPC